MIILVYSCYISNLFWFHFLRKAKLAREYTEYTDQGHENLKNTSYEK